MEIHQHVLFFDLNQKFEFLDQVHHDKNEILATKKNQKNIDFNCLVTIITYIGLVLAITIASGWSSTHIFIILLYLKYLQIILNLFYMYITMLYIRNTKKK